MKPYKHAMTTHTLGAPVGWDEQKYGPCAGLPVLHHEGVIYSFWRPSIRERIALLFGRSVQLGVVSNAQPPVSIEVL